MTDEMILTLIDRLTARVVELEAWRARWEHEVVTERIVASYVTVQQEADGPSVVLRAYADWAEARVGLGELDQSAMASLVATDELIPPEAMLILRINDDDLVELTTNGVSRTQPPSSASST